MAFRFIFRVFSCPWLRPAELGRKSPARRGEFAYHCGQLRSDENGRFSQESDWYAPCIRSRTADRFLMNHELNFSVQTNSLPRVNADNTGGQSWFALKVLPRHEKMVALLLGHKGYSTFLPTCTRRHQYAARARSFELPLFPGYLFSRFDPAARLPILTTPGVVHVVGAGRIPIAVNEGEIVAIRRAVEARVPMTPLTQWHAGQRGRITEGPLAGIEGVVLRVKPTVRLVLSVTLLKRSVLVEIEGHCVSVP